MCLARSAVESGDIQCVLGFARVSRLNSTADESLPAKNSLHSSEEFTGGISLQDITLRSSAQSCPYQISIADGSQKDNLCTGSDLENALSIRSDSR
jgi:hypothetical protein